MMARIKNFRIAKYALTFLMETVSAVAILFFAVIPSMYLLVKLGNVKDPYTEALAQILAYALGYSWSSVMWFRPLWLGFASGLAMTVYLIRLISLVAQQQDVDMPSSYQLFDRIAKVPHGQKNAVCSELLRYLEQMIPSEPKP